MRRSAALLLTLVCLTAAGLAPVALAGKKAPPLLDRELFFGDPEISQAQISPDGRFIAFIKPLDGTRNVWVKQTAEPFDKARPLTADTERPIPGYFWSRDSRWILFVQDQAGDENYNIHAVDPAAEPAAGQKVPAARNLTAIEGVRAQIYAVPRTKPDVIYVGLNDRDKAWHDLYRLQISTGERTLVRENTERIAGWAFDTTGELRLATRVADNGSTEILAVGEQGFTPVYTCSVFESCGPVRYHKDGQRVYMVTNQGDDVDLTRLILFDPRTRTEELVESDPLKRVDFGTPIFSDATDELLATVYEDERLRIYWRDASLKADYERLTKQLRGKDVLPGSATADERLWLFTATSDVEPGERYLFDRDSKKLTFQYRAFEDLPREHLAAMEPVTYPSSDGLEIPAFLTLPRGVPAAKLPLMVVPHGGPWARDGWGYDAFAQFLANRGYAVLQPNFRGSTGYGKKFLNAGNNEWGLKMQDDLTWGVRYLVGRGIADPARVGIMGGSYGGYATLAGVTFTPDTYTAAVSIVGPSNLITLLDSIPPYWEAIRTIFHHRMGDPTTAEGRALLERASPLNAADRIKTPLLVVQGANDPRVKQRESDQIVIALRERKYPVEYLVAPDEGHGFAKPVNNMAMFAAAEKFLAKHLGGRYQEGMPTDVAAKLSELTVDVATVKLPDKVDVAAAGTPQPVAGLVPGTSRYEAKIDLGGQQIQLAMGREVKDEGELWLVIDTVETPMGQGEERAWLRKGSLAVVSRKARQGPTTVEVDVHDQRASGKLSMGGQERPIDIALGGDLYGDGAGAYEALGALPLAEGFSTIYRNLDLMAQKEKLMKLVVGAIETVTVPAGTYEAWRLDIAPANGDPGRASVWVARDSRKVVKTTAIVPEMGGATVTSELMP
jgi:dipeptidyl aminopeptidase/acylaminoacyl peptidase